MRISTWLKRCALAATCVLALSGGGTPAWAQDVSSSIVAGDFATLKAAIEDPERDTEIVVPGGTYTFTDTVTVSKDLTIKNAAGEKVTFALGMFNHNADSLGKTMMDVTAGTLTLDGDSNDNLVFDGVSGLPAFDHTQGPVLNHAYEVNNNISDRGVFVTYNQGTVGVINHATFTNASNGGALTGAIFVRAKASITMNDGLFTHNHLSYQSNTSNSAMLQDPNKAPARSANIGLYGGSFTMNGGAITDGYSSFDPAPAIGATGAVQNGGGMSRAKITINGGTISNNSAHRYQHDDENLNLGGAIWLGVNSDMVINDGTFSNNYVKGAGGFAFLDWGTTTQVNGGTFKNNKADQAGGAFAIYDRFMKYDPSSSENVAGKDNDYGITDINWWYNRGLGSSLKVNGGTFDGNSAYMGGALYIAADKAEVNAGTFTNNQANRFGGAIYLSTAPYRLKIRNAYVANNTATDDSITLGSNIYPDLNTNMYHTASGGGIWYCPTGDGDVNVSNGLAVVSNTARGEGTDFTSMKKSDATKYKVSVANRMLGGGYVTWQDDLQDARATNDTPEHTNIVDETGDIMLKATASERSIETAKALATTVFTNNTAKRGGAIASNGHVDFGDANLTFDLKIQKEWDELISAKTEATAEVFIVTKDASGKETEHFVEEVTLNQDNNFTATISGLPLETYGRSTYRVKELGDTYDVNYSTAIKDAAPSEGNTFSTADLVDGDTVTVTMTNHPKFNATYEYKSATEGKELTDEILVQLPQDKTALSIGTKVDAEIPAQATFDSPEGTWTFEGWDFDTQTIKDKDIHFVGLWKWTPKFNATYEFRSETEGKELIPEILALLPKDRASLPVGTEVKTTTPDQTTFEVEDGTWTFVAWDFDAQTIEDSDIHFIGTWKFTPKEIEEPPAPGDDTHEPNDEEDGQQIPETSDFQISMIVLAIFAGAGLCLAYGAVKLRK